MYKCKLFGTITFIYFIFIGSLLNSCTKIDFNENINKNMKREIFKNEKRLTFIMLYYKILSGTILNCGGTV